MVRRHTHSMSIRFDTSGSGLTHCCVCVMLCMCVFVSSVRGAMLSFHSPINGVTANQHILKQLLGFTRGVAADVPLTLHGYY